VLLAGVQLAHPGKPHPGRMVCIPPFADLAVVLGRSVIDDLDVVGQPGLAEQRVDGAVQDRGVLVVHRDVDGNPEPVELGKLPLGDGERLLLPGEDELRHDERNGHAPCRHHRLTGEKVTAQSPSVQQQGSCGNYQQREQREPAQRAEGDIGDVIFVR